MVSEGMTDEWIEIEGTSKEDAIERACNALNTTSAYLAYEVIGEKGKGAKIRARKIDTPKEVSKGMLQEMPHEMIDEVLEVGGEDTSEGGKRARGLLQELLRFIDETVEVTLKETKEEIALEITADGSGLLIGRHGQTLEALQHILAKMLGLDRQSGKRLLIDSERYRARRQEALENLARKLAGRARKERRSISVEPMSALDRRILHLALANNRYVTTKSVGEGANRKVVVSPRNFSGSDTDTAGERRSAVGRRGDRRHPDAGRNRGERQRFPRRGPSRPSSMQDSFDVPPLPETDLFQDDDAYLEEGLDLEEGKDANDMADTHEQDPKLKIGIPE